MLNKHRQGKPTDDRVAKQTGRITHRLAKIMDNHCSRKKCYPNKNVARGHANFQSKRSGESIEFYKCKFGSHYHIGHKLGTK